MGRRMAIRVFHRLFLCEGLRDCTYGDYNNNLLFSFSKQYSAEMYLDRQPHETPSQHQDRLVVHAAAWLSQHLQGIMPVVLLALDDATVEKWQRMLPTGSGVLVQTLDAYMAGMWVQGVWSGNFVWYVCV